MMRYLMASSDGEGEILSDFVDEYYFVDQSNIAVKFSLLPAKWEYDEDDDEYPTGSNSRGPVYLRGNTDCGNKSVCKLVKAWNFDLSDEHHPKIEVLLHGMRWISLHEPAKSYEASVRTTLVTLHCLHFVKRNPEASSDDVWNSLDKVDGIQPSVHELSDHVSLVCEAMKRDEDLTKSKCLRRFLEKTSQTTQQDTVMQSCKVPHYSCSNIPASFQSRNNLHASEFLRCQKQVQVPHT